LAKVIERKRGIKVKPSQFTRTPSLAETAMQSGQNESGDISNRDLTHFYCSLVKRHDRQLKSVVTTWRMRDV